MAKLNMIKLKKAVPALGKLTLDGESDYTRVNEILVSAGYDNSNLMVWKIIDGLGKTKPKGKTLASFFE